jgi:hypothetical protein
MAWTSRRWLFGAALVLGLASACSATMKTAELLVTDTERTIRERAPGEAQSSPHRAPILVIAFDGVNRGLLYEMLERGELPKLTDLLSGEGKSFPHAYFDSSLVSTMPSSTMAAWTSVFTGAPPAEHGVTGNEFFIREEARLAAPAPVSFNDAKPTIEIYTDDYLNALIQVPTVYERLRAEEPQILIWVALSQVYRGGDRMIFATSTVLADALEEGVVKVVKKASLQTRPDRSAFEMLDNDVVAKVVSALDEEGPLPDVLTVYLSGTDLYAHVAEEGPDQARRAYLREVADPALGRLAEKLRQRGALKDRWVVLTSDHGHTPVRHDREHALWTDGEDSPPGLMRKAGYHVRPFQEKVAKDTPYDAVLCEGGATAFIYLADRSTCTGKSRVCDWRLPPRYEEDVLPLAEAFYRNDLDGKLVPRLKGTLDLVLTRKPRPYSDTDLPFEVYVGDGKTVPVTTYIQQHPHPTYVEIDTRLRDLAAGPRGERAGDIMLLAHSGDRDIPDQRYYFASLYRSWHGSPSHQDSDIPLIVANPHHSSERIHDRVEQALGPRPRQQRVTDLLLALRSQTNAEPRAKTATKSRIP